MNFPQEQKLWDEIKGLLAALQSDIVDAATQTKKGKQSRCQARAAPEITLGPAFSSVTTSTQLLPADFPASK